LADYWQLLLFQSAGEKHCIIWPTFITERPQSIRAPDISFFAELLALITCPIGLLLFALSLALFIRSGTRTASRA
jgi:hypothetical protein